LGHELRLKQASPEKPDVTSELGEHSPTAKSPEVENVGFSTWLVLKTLALRHQLAALKRQAHKPKLQPTRTGWTCGASGLLGASEGWRRRLPEVARIALFHPIQADFAGLS
jgi:hypothetical protein